jgi:hypothetical protein
VAFQSLQGPWPPHTRGFVVSLRHFVELPWTSDQPVAKASTYRGQHNTETQRQTNIRAPSGIRTKEPSNPATKTYALHRAAPTKQDNTQRYFPDTRRSVIKNTLNGSLSDRGGQRAARAMYSTVQLIKPKNRSVLTDEHLTELVPTAVTTYRRYFNNLTAYPQLYNFCS